jgi:DNA-binding transcriptional regulator YhcF (GntR family)
MLLIQLDKSSNFPIYQQIIREIKNLIDAATLKTGYRLPSSRDLASKLGVNRSTVYRAYQELWAQGYVDCIPGSYTTVRYRNFRIDKRISKADSKVDWEKRSSKTGKEIFKIVQRKKPQNTSSTKIDFVSLSPDPRLNPVDDFRRCRNQVMRSIGSPLLQYGDLYGYAPLRDFIAHRLRLYMVNLDPEEVLITNGVQQALNLICQLLLHPGAPAVVEEPTYSAILPVFSLYGAKVIGIRQGESGLDLDYLLDEVPSAIEQSFTGIEKVNTIISSMKEFARPGIAEKIDVDINAAIMSTVNISANEWKYYADIETDLSPGLPTISCVPGELNQAFLNIIVNAAHAIADGLKGEIIFDKGKITISTSQEDEWIKIRISDTGPGIPDDIKSKIFDPFFTTRDVGKGIGQGLTVAYSIIVEKHAGEIEVQSVPGKGATFVVRLPIPEAARLGIRGTG